MSDTRVLSVLSLPEDLLVPRCNIAAHIHMWMLKQRLLLFACRCRGQRRLCRRRRRGIFILRCSKMMYFYYRNIVAPSWKLCSKTYSQSIDHFCTTRFCMWEYLYKRVWVYVCEWMCQTVCSLFTNIKCGERRKKTRCYIVNAAVNLPYRFVLQTLFISSSSPPIYGVFLLHAQQHQDSFILFLEFLFAAVWAHGISLEYTLSCFFSVELGAVAFLMKFDFMTN